MTPQAYLYICDGDIDHPVLTHKKMDWPEKYPHWQEIPLFMAQPEQEPAAVGRWPSAAIGKETLQDAIERERAVGYREGHRAALAQRTWVGLTDEEKKDFWTADQMTQEEWDELFVAIEDKLKEKNT